MFDLRELVNIEDEETAHNIFTVCDKIDTLCTQPEPSLRDEIVKIVNQALWYNNCGLSSCTVEHHRTNEFTERIMAIKERDTDG